MLINYYSVIRLTFIMFVLAGAIEIANANEIIQLLNVNAVSKEINATNLLRKIGKPTNKVLRPVQLSLDLNDNVIEGVTVTYGDDVEFEEFVKAVDSENHKWRRDTEGKHVRNLTFWKKFGLAWWRNEETRMAIQVARGEEGEGPQMLVIWLDRGRQNDLGSVMEAIKRIHLKAQNNSHNGLDD